MKPTNEQIAKWVTRSTTTRFEKVIVLYNDGQWALVKWPSATSKIYGGLFGDYCPPWVTQYDLSKMGTHIAEGENVWSCSRDSGDGPMTAANLKKLVQERRLNEAFMFPPVRRLGKQEPIRVERKPEKERRFKLRTFSTQVYMAIEGELPHQWCGVVTSANIVGNVSSVDWPCSSVMVEYNTLADCIEFFKGDREKILDALEAAS